MHSNFLVDETQELSDSSKGATEAIIREESHLFAILKSFIASCVGRVKCMIDLGDIQKPRAETEKQDILNESCKSD